MKNGYIIDTLTSVDFLEIVKIGWKLNETFEGVIYRKKIKIPPLGKAIDKLFVLRQKYNDENIELMQRLVKLFMNSLYGL